MACRLLADNHVASALVQALERAIRSSKETLPSSKPHDFSIAAVHITTSSTTASNKQNPTLLNGDLISALLQAAVAFSTSQQLSEQLLSSGVMAPVALLLNRGGVHDHHTSQAVELLWNLLEACPLLEAHSTDSYAAANSYLAAWHSQIPKPKQKATAPSEAASTSGEGQNGDDNNDVKQVSAGRPDDAAHTEVGGQHQDGAQAEEQCEDAASTPAESSSQEPQQASADRPGDCTSSAAGSSAGVEGAAAPAAAAGDVTVGGDAKAAADTPDEGVSGAPLDSGCAAAQSCLSADSNSQRCTNHDNTPSASQDCQAAEGVSGADCQDAVTTGVTPQVGVEEAVARGISRVLTDCLEHGYSTADKELRNTVLVVAGMLAESRHYRDGFCRHGMLQQLLIAGTEPELGDCSTACFRVRCTLSSASVLAHH